MKDAYKISGFILFTTLLLWLGKPFLVPIAYALIIAIVLYPLCRYLESRGFGKGISIAVSLIIPGMLFAGLITLLGYELVLLSRKWPMIHTQIDPYFNRLQLQLQSEFGWTVADQITWLKDNLNALSRNAGTYLNETLNAIIRGLFQLIIVPIYIVIFLLFRGRFVAFIMDFTPEKYQTKIGLIIQETVVVFARFIRGMVLVYLTVGLLNTLGLWIIGVENAFVYGMLSAVMTIIPYFGIIISALLPITLTWIETGSLWMPLGIISVFAVVQYLEANLIFPYVVGRFVNLNIFASIVAIFLGALIWGVAGMILFIPFLAVFRLVASHFPEMKPWTRLLGNE